MYSGKNFSLRLITLNYKEKMFFKSNYFVSRSFFMSCHYTKTFVHLLIIAAVSDFNAFKLTGWYPANIFLFKVNSRNTRKRFKIFSELVGHRSGSLLLTLNIFRTFFYCCNSSLWTDKCLSGSSFLCKLYYSEYEDEGMLYLTSFKIAADFLNA